MKTTHPLLLNLRRNLAGTYVVGTYDTALDLRIKSDGITTEGYLAVFGKKDAKSTIPIKGCYAKSIRERGPKSASNNKIAFLRFHDKQQPAGQFIDLREDDYGLYFKATHNKEVQRQRETGIEINDGTLNQFSYGFIPVWDKMEWDEGRQGAVMYECDVREGSVLTINAAEEATYAIRSDEEREAALLDLGEKAELFLSSFPRDRQIELRQLFSEYKTLASAEPLDVEQALQNRSEPDKSKNNLVAIGGYKLDPKQFLIQ